MIDQAPSQEWLGKELQLLLRRWKARSEKLHIRLLRTNHLIVPFLLYLKVCPFHSALDSVRSKAKSSFDHCGALGTITLQVAITLLDLEND